MKKNFICKFIVSGSLFFFSLGMFAQRVSADLPWSVRMVESEILIIFFFIFLIKTI